MTLNAPIAKRHNFTGNDVATSFSYTKKITDQDHIKLVHTDTAGLENALADPLVVDVDYTVNGVGDSGGGTVDFPKAGSVYSTLATGEKLSIIYDFPTEQQLDVPNTGRVFNVDVEDQLDYLTNLINQAEELLDRALKLPEGSTLTDIAFPVGTGATNRATTVAVWNALGTALELLKVTSGLDVAPIAVKGDIAQGDTNGDPAKLAIGGTGAILSVVAGLLAYTAIGSTNDTLQVVGGVPTWVTQPIIDLAKTQHFPRFYLAGLGLSNGTDTDHDIDIAVGECKDGANGEDIVLASIITKQIDAVWSVGNDAGGLDTGSVAIDTWYHLFAIKRTDTDVVDVLFSTSSTSPTMPTNYDKKRRIGSVLTDGSANIIAFLQQGDEFLWSVPVSDYSGTNPGTSAVTRTLTVPTGVVIWAKHVFRHTDSSPSADGNAIITSLDQADTVPTSDLNHTRVTVESEIGTVEIIVKTNTSGQIRTRIDNSDAGVSNNGTTFGWIDRRGRDD